MALSNSEISGILFKKLQGVGSTAENREFFEEPFPGRSFVTKAQIWRESDLIPDAAPSLADTAISGVVQYFEDKTLTAVAGTTVSFQHADLVDAIPFNFGDGTSYNYAIKDSGATGIPFGTNDWVLDTDAGTLTFYNGVPSNMPPTVSFYKYVGKKQTITVEAGITAYAGGGQGSATALVEDWNIVATTATAADSVLLPDAVVGREVVVYNDGAAAAAVFPDTGDTIDGGAANASVSLDAGGQSTYRCVVAGAWRSVSGGSEPAADIPTQSYEIANLGIAASVGASALTIALKQADGSSDATTGNPVKVGFRSATIGSGAYTQREITSSLSMTVSSGSTLGTKSATAHYIYLYAIDNAGAVELAVTMTQVDEGVLQTTVAEGGAGAADLNRNLYSTTARTDVPVRLIARLKSTQTTAGTWAAVPTAITPIPFAAEVIEANLSLTTTMSYVDTSATILWDTVLKDTHNMYSAGTVTAPRAGTMTISGIVLLTSVTAATTASIRVGGTHSRRLDLYETAVSTTVRHGAFVFSLEAAKGDTFSLDIYGDASFSVIGARTAAFFKLT